MAVPRMRESSRAVSQKASATVLREFLEDSTNVTKEPAAFQLRCKQMYQLGSAAAVPKKVVIVIDGKCKLWKLNQIIAECFNASHSKFVHHPKKGATVPGSCFVASRPLQPGRCNKALICSSETSTQLRSGDNFVDDRRYSVAQLFRGTSTRYALHREQADAAQTITLASPLLNADVTVRLDGIMLESYDSRNPFDPKRRHANGRRPLPRIVRSSFLSDVEIEAKNFVMQGYWEGSQVNFDSSYPAIQNYYRLSQRKPLFRKDGRDFDLNDPCHMAKDEESDTDIDADDMAATIR